MLSFLASAGADLQAVDNKGRAPVHEAAAGGHVEALKALVAAKCSFDVETDAGQSVLALAKGEAK